MSPDIVALLMEMRNGQTAALANERFTEVLDAVRATRCKGRLVIQLEVEPAEIDSDTNEVSRVKINPDIKMVRPEPKLGTGIYFVTQDGGLSRQDPKQFEMFGGDQVEQEVKKDGGVQ